MLRVKPFFSILLFIALVTLAYSAWVLFPIPGTNKYGKLSLDYLLLTPEDIANIATFCEQKPQFTHIAANGPAPVIIEHWY